MGCSWGRSRSKVGYVNIDNLINDAEGGVLVVGLVVDFLDRPISQVIFQNEANRLNCGNYKVQNLRMKLIFDNYPLGSFESFLHHEQCSRQTKTSRVFSLKLARTVLPYAPFACCARTSATCNYVLPTPFSPLSQLVNWSGKSQRCKT